METTVRLRSVEAFELDPGPLPVPFQDSTMGPFTHWKLGWIRLTADDGVAGEAPGRIHPLLADALRDDAARTVDQWWHRLFWLLRNNGHRSPDTSGAVGSIDMALRDILARRAGQPWHRFAGAQRDTVPVYGSGGGTNLPREELVREMRDLVRCGFRTLKMKVGTAFGTRAGEDVERVKAVREAVGAGIALAVDGNQTWTAEEALAFARRIAPLDIAWFEEPVHSADRLSLRELCRTCPFPVAMGESENHWLGFRDLLECGVQHLQPSPHCLPGLERWRDAVAWAEQGAVWSAGGLSHLTAMFVATRPGGSVEYLRAIIGPQATCWSRKPEIADGEIRLPASPGLAVQVDWDGLAARGAVRKL